MDIQIADYIRAGYPALYVVSPEEERVEAEMKRVAAELKFTLHVWSVTDGLVDLARASVRPVHEPLEALLAIKELSGPALVLLRDFHLFLGSDASPVLLRQFKDLLREAKTQNKAVVVMGCRLCLPPELEREITVIEWKLPDRLALSAVLNGILQSAGLPPLVETAQEAALQAASGLTTTEAENAYALSVAQTGGISAELVGTLKAQTFRKGGLLEVIESDVTIEQIGGLDLLKQWLLSRKAAFTPAAREYGLPVPKGLLITGIPGTGKSLTAKATASVFQVPLLKLDAGRLFGSLVGQSEGNMRAVIQAAEAVAPCVLWLDELDKGFSGIRSSGSSDGGTAARVFGSFISWMQEKSAAVFVVATANDVSQLPPEFLRKGRWDELFFVDLPNQAERESIWRLQIGRHHRNPRDYDLVQLARASDGFTGSEIEAAYVESLYDAFEAGGEPTDLVVAHVLATTSPLSCLMPEQISGLRNWSKGRARMATSQPPEGRTRKLAA